MPEVEIVGKIMGSLIAGYNTISIAIAFFTNSVRERPDIYSKILASNNGFLLIIFYVMEKHLIDFLKIEAIGDCSLQAARIFYGMG